MLRFHLLLLAIAPALLFAPPSRGAILLLPIAPATPAQTINWARENGATLIAAGPYSGAIVVNGDLAALAGPALAHGALLSSASAAGCAPVSE